MISAEYVRTLAAYNRWQNGSLYGAAASLSDDQRKQQRGAFFGSIHGTLNHILWGDQIWLSRFISTPPPTLSIISESADLYPHWDELVAARNDCDEIITAWTENMDPAWLDGALTWTSAANNRTFRNPTWMLVTHLFNHQIHHRGQVHAMLTAAGAKPDDTDIPLMPS